MTEPREDLNKGFCKSTGTGIIMQTLFAVDFGLQLLLAFTRYFILVGVNSFLSTSTHINGFIFKFNL